MFPFNKNQRIFIVNNVSKISHRFIDTQIQAGCTEIMLLFKKNHFANNYGAHCMWHTHEILWGADGQGTHPRKVYNVVKEYNYISTRNQSVNEEM